MATYTLQSQVVGEILHEPSTNEDVQAITIDIVVLKDGQSIGNVHRRFSAQATLDSMRTRILEDVRKVIQDELVSAALIDLQQRAGVIQNALDVWEYTI